MQEGYFKTAWRDMTSSERWLPKTLLLALVGVIPIFGQIVRNGYLLGWAREAAWGVQTPMPAHIFEDPDGKLYLRGFFALVIGLVLVILPACILAIGYFLSTGSLVPAGLLVGDALRHYPQLSAASGGIMAIAWCAAAVAFVLSVPLYWAGCMRMSIYGRLSAGLQLGKSWQMIRHDFKGILRIMGLALIMFAVGAVADFLLQLACRINIVLVVVGFFSVAYNGEVAPVLATLALCAFLFLACLYAVSLVTTIADILIIRSVGRWTAQFKVPQWRGQDDPLPLP